MAEETIRVAVVGHTNTGKTSLMRTLLRDVNFGEVSDRPAVTREVEGAAITVHGADAKKRRRGEQRLLLYDTPGLEDSIGLADFLQELRGERRIDGIELIRELFASSEGASRFSQEVKALRQVLDSDVALYVVDARDRVLGKHRDELTILAYCARPVVPVLNFVAAEESRTSAWREQLSRVNMHAIAEFDTVVFDARSEEQLFEKIRTLLDSHETLLTALIEERREERRRLIGAASRTIAELLVDAAAYVEVIPDEGDRGKQAALEQFKETIRQRENACVRQLLDLFRFREEDYAAGDLPIEGGKWGVDLFSPAALKQFSVSAGGGAAAGAMAGLTVDALVGGLSLGAGALLGAAAGATLGAGWTHGKRLMRRAQGATELRCDDATLLVLRARGLALAGALLQRGHAAVKPIELKLPKEDAAGQKAWKHLWDEARQHPRWVRAIPGAGAASADPRRQATVQEMAELLEGVLGRGRD
jgi:GTPase Era involved in 16S rRNA processing